jgi:NDP-sugar pyrophosphorylase family protein
VAGAPHSLSLVVLAAGVGSRFGGDKTLQPVGPGGEVLFDYSVFDARRAGFSRVVFVLGPGAAETFRKRLGRRYEPALHVTCLEQRLEDAPAGRRKPWGTAHAVLAAGGALDGPFAVANADDFYGARSWAVLAEHLSHGPAARGVLAAFRLADTLPVDGPVSRAVCDVDATGRLRSIVEAVVERTPRGLAGLTAAGSVTLTGDEFVSMNLWGLPADVMPSLREGFARFLAHSGGSTTAEYLLPSAIDDLVREGRLEVGLARAPGPWLGITRREDVEPARRRLRELTASGAYPSPLWG